MRTVFTKNVFEVGTRLKLSEGEHCAKISKLLVSFYCTWCKSNEQSFRVSALSVRFILRLPLKATLEEMSFILLVWQRKRTPVSRCNKCCVLFRKRGMIHLCLILEEKNGLARLPHATCF